MFSFFGRNSGASGFNLTEFQILDTSALCDPTVGTFLARFRIEPIPNSGVLSARIRYKIGAGGVYTNYASAFDPADYIGSSGEGLFAGEMEGQIGFLTLDNTYFELIVTRAGEDIPSSPTEEIPPYTCIS